MRKSRRELERIVKGFASHRRLEILNLLKKEPELSLQEISKRINSDFKNVSAHINKMAIAGLVIKRNELKLVKHKLTKRGLNVLTFVRTLE